MPSSLLGRPRQHQLFETAQIGFPRLPFFPREVHFTVDHACIHPQTATDLFGVGGTRPVRPAPIGAVDTVSVSRELRAMSTIFASRKLRAKSTDSVHSSLACVLGNLRTVSQSTRVRQKSTRVRQGHESHGQNLASTVLYASKGTFLRTRAASMTTASRASPAWGIDSCIWP